LKNKELKVKIMQKKVLLLVMLVITNLSLFSQVWPWIDISGDKPNIYEVFSVNDTLYTHTRYKIFYSSNNGISWHLLVEFPDIISIITVSEDNKIYCYFANSLPGTMVNGSVLTGFCEPYECTGLSVFGRLLITFNNLLFIGCGDEVYKSSDQGANWQYSANGLPTGFTSYCNQGEFLYSLHSDGNRVYAGTNCHGIYRSDNNGASWYPTNEGIPMQTKTRVYYIINNSERIYISTGKGVYYSENLGLNWLKENSLPTISSGGPLHLKDTNIMYIGNDSIYTSYDNGSSWSSINYEGHNQFINSQIIAADTGAFYISKAVTNNVLSKLEFSDTMAKTSSYGLAHNQALYLFKEDSLLLSSTYNGGLYRSENLGETWITSDEFLAGKIINTLIKFNNSLYAGTNSGVYISSDMGLFWVYHSNIGLKVENLVIHSDYLYCTIDKIIHRLSEDFTSWIIFNNGIENSSTNYLYFNDEFIYACTNEGVSYLDAQNDLWISLSSFPVTNISSMAINNNEIYIGDGNTIYHSSNEGNDWQFYELNSGVDVYFFAFVNDSILVATNSGVYIRNNSYWEVSNLFIDTKHLLVDDSITYASTVWGVYKGNNNDVITSINSQPSKQNNSITIYPNPATEKLTIDYDKEIKVEIYSITGKLVIFSNNYQIDISKLFPSIYLITRVLMF
jgi:ligand-binding sensor domain-containing protein